MTQEIESLFASNQLIIVMNEKTIIVSLKFNA